MYAEEMEKLEKKENSAIEYEKWLQTKKEQIKKAKRRKLRRDASKEKVILISLFFIRHGISLYSSWSNNIILILSIYIMLRTRKKNKKESAELN